MSKTKKLTKAEHLEMELNHEQIRNVLLEKEIIMEKQRILMLEKKVADLEHEKKVKKSQDKITTVMSKLSLAQKESNEFNQKLKTKYKIKESFGINPDTGEILED